MLYLSLCLPNENSCGASSPRSSRHSSSRSRFCIRFSARSFSSMRSCSSLFSMSISCSK